MEREGKEDEKRDRRGRGEARRWCSKWMKRRKSTKGKKKRRSRVVEDEEKDNKDTEKLKEEQE